MANSFVASRAQIIYAVCLPVAVLLGYLLADPTDTGSIAVVSVLVAVLSVPLLMHWYHPLLVFTWNAAIMPFFLPGSPHLWLLIAFAGIGFAVVNRFTSAEVRFESPPSVVKPLLFLVGVFLITAMLRGGIGLRSFGSSQYGGRNYIYCLAAIAGFFSLSSQRIPAHRARLFTAIFFLSGLTALMSNLAYLGGPRTEFLFSLFPPEYALEQALATYSVNAEFVRIYGLTLSSVAIYAFLLSQYGLRGIFDFSKPWRFLLFLCAIIGSIFCGFRGYFVLMLLTLGFQFIFEGLCKAKIVASVGAVALVIGALLVPNAEKLPLVAQRTLSFLPIRLNPAVRETAQLSSEWRLKMWGDVLADVPQYLLKGKGYAIDPREVELADLNWRRGYGPIYGWALASGVYHSGPLTLLVPFGIWGVIGFLWFAVVAIRYLYRNFRHGDPALHSINTFLLACFVARLTYFVGIFGLFSMDLFLFTGLVGLSAALNGRELPEKEALESESEEVAEGEALVAAHETGLHARDGM